MENTNEALFCDECSLQFDKKIVYDIHQSFVHRTKDKVEVKEKTIKIYRRFNEFFDPLTQ